MTDIDPAVVEKALAAWFESVPEGSTGYANVAERIKERSRPRMTAALAASGLVEEVARLRHLADTLTRGTFADQAALIVAEAEVTRLRETALREGIEVLANSGDPEGSVRRSALRALLATPTTEPQAGEVCGECGGVGVVDEPSKAVAADELPCGACNGSGSEQVRQEMAVVPDSPDVREVIERLRKDVTRGPFQPLGGWVHAIPPERLADLRAVLAVLRPTEEAEVGIHVCTTKCPWPCQDTARGPMTFSDDAF